MKKQTGILIKDTGELQISIKRDSSGKIISGLVIGNTLYQNQFMILKAQKGEFKEYPLLGVGIDDIVNDNDILLWKKRIREELAKDGMKVGKLSLTSNSMELKAEYK